MILAMVLQAARQVETQKGHLQIGPGSISLDSSSRRLLSVGWKRNRTINKVKYDQIIF